MKRDSSSIFLKACRREPTERTPVWFMRQAGRYMKEYRELRARHSLLEMCHTPELAAQVTLQPVNHLGVDAAIIFADLLLPAQAMGMNLEFAEGEGPQLTPVVDSIAAVRKLREPVDGELAYVGEAIKLVQRELSGKVPLIGFCGGPFTLASYMIEGGSSRNFLKTKLMMYREPETWKELMEKLVRILSEFLRSQIEAGADAVQIFDSWVGCLCPEDYRKYVLPHSSTLIASVRSRRVPVIHFGTGTATLLEWMRIAGGDVMGIDWRIELAEGWDRVGPDVAVQGNLDPVLLMGPLDNLRERVKDILISVQGRPGHIFNLGHGILQHTPVENVKAVVEMVREFSAAKS